MGQFSGPLYDWADKSLAERTELYRKQADTVFCTDEIAATFDRVLWLKDENIEKPFRRVLEVGCHDGFITRWLAGSEEMTAVYGIDPCKVAIDLAVKHAPDDRFAYIDCGFEEIDLALNPFDVLICYELLEHFLPEEVQDLFTWMSSHARPGARLFFCTPNRFGHFGETNDDPCHVQLFTASTMLTALTTGFPGATIGAHLIFEGCHHLMMKVTMP